ncbi:MAG: matrixin family metalloprotease [Candidatus Levyibacteriota bacterium]
MKKRFLFLLFAVFVLGGMYFVFDKQINSLANNVLYYSPCNSPIHYAIGNIDPRFNISSSQVSADILQAGNIWNSAENKQLFTYDPQGKLVISFVYDQRQALNSQIQNLDQTLKNEKSTIDPKLVAYQQEAKDFQTKLDNLNSEIDSWNNKGGAPPDVYKSLTDQQKNLQQEAVSLNAMATSLNQSTGEFNANVNSLNQTVSTFNQTLQTKPEEGLYDGQNNTISIYFVNTKNELIHTLAHEMGHALGFVHVSTANSIMYAQTNQHITPSQDDLKELAEICTPKSIFLLGWKRITGNIAAIIAMLQNQKQ